MPPEWSHKQALCTQEKQPNSFKKNPKAWIFLARWSDAIDSADMALRLRAENPDTAMKLPPAPKRDPSQHGTISTMGEAPSVSISVRTEQSQTTGHGRHSTAESEACRYRFRQFIRLQPLPMTRRFFPAGCPACSASSVTSLRDEVSGVPAA